MQALAAKAKAQVAEECKAEAAEEGPSRPADGGRVAAAGSQQPQQGEKASAAAGGAAWPSAPHGAGAPKAGKPPIPSKSLPEPAVKKNVRASVKAQAKKKAKLSVPKYWANRGDSDKQQLIVEGEEVKNAVQALIDRTWIDVKTRDRKEDKLPVKLQVHSVHRNENPALWAEYTVERKRIVGRMADARANPPEWTAKTMDQESPVVKRAALAQAAGEGYFFHGSKPAAVKNICAEDFKLSLAGTGKGALYGRGLYFAEASSKADEYAGEDAGDALSAKRLHAMLLCRVVCGRILYNDQEKPDAELLERKCAVAGSGEFDSVLGDREACRGTYREYVVYQASQAYPEYIVVYRRITKKKSEKKKKEVPERE